MTRGTFITFEGVEGSGKSTQALRVHEDLRSRGIETLLTKEPGGTPIGDRIRAILLDPNAAGMDSLTELYLYAASRRQHVVEVIRPALERGAVVICDRFTDATLAYQGFGRGLELDRLRGLNDWATSGLAPRLTLVFDLAEETGVARARARNVETHRDDEGRFEAESLRFHRRVREGYLALAKAEPERFVVIDAEGSIDDVFVRTIAAITERAGRSEGQ